MYYVYTCKVDWAELVTTPRLLNLCQVNAHYTEVEVEMPLQFCRLLHV